LSNPLRQHLIGAGSPEWRLVGVDGFDHVVELTERTRNVEKDVKPHWTRTLLESSDCGSIDSGTIGQLLDRESL
jgi:hypothetical protein